jgi:hypothetical protein
MRIRRQQALIRLEGLARQVEEHLEKTAGRAAARSAALSERRAAEINMPASPELIELLGRIFDSGRKGDRKGKRYEQRRHDFIFHMTDWLGDLKKLNELYTHPENADLHEATISIIALLYHVIPHLNAAGRLLLDTITDPFAPSQEKPPGEETRAKPKVKRKRKPRSRAG